MFCKTCGGEVVENAFVCPHCGVKIQSPKDENETIGALGILCFLFPMVGLILYLSWKDSKPKKSKGAGKWALWGLILVPVVIVGTSVAVGITMFNNQAYNANQQAMAGELQNFGAQIIQYYKEPLSQGGAGQDIRKVTIESVADYIDFQGIDPKFSRTTDNGTYIISSIDGNSIILKGLGRETKSAEHPLVTTTIELDTGMITTGVGAATSF